MSPVPSNNCPECGNQRVEVKPLVENPGDFDEHLYLQQPLRSATLFTGKKSNKSFLRVLACINCGYTAWYATEPKNLIPDG